MTWRGYAGALVVFNLLGGAVVLLLQLTQAHLPLNPQGFSAVPLDIAVNAAVSFLTNTNWQAYSGESSLGFLTQMAGLGVQDFLSVATIGNFWADLVRATFCVLLPLSLLLAVALVGQGVVMSFSPAVQATTLAGAEQLIPQGPAASRIAIKQLGTNGGGFFGVNSAHPLENPTSFPISSKPSPSSCCPLRSVTRPASSRWRARWTRFGVATSAMPPPPRPTAWSTPCTPPARPSTAA